MLKIWRGHFLFFEDICMCISLMCIWNAQRNNRRMDASGDKCLMSKACFRMYHELVEGWNSAITSEKKVRMKVYRTGFVSFFSGRHGRVVLYQRLFVPLFYD